MICSNHLRQERTDWHTGQSYLEDHTAELSPLFILCPHLCVQLLHLLYTMINCWLIVVRKWEWKRYTEKLTSVSLLLQKVKKKSEKWSFPASTLYHTVACGHQLNILAHRYISYVNKPVFQYLHNWSQYSTMDSLLLKPTLKYKVTHSLTLGTMFCRVKLVWMNL